MGSVLVEDVEEILAGTEPKARTQRRIDSNGHDELEV
jgi:hypothetical protein